MRCRPSRPAPWANASRCSHRSGIATGSTCDPSSRTPPAIRRLLYTTNAIESLHMQLRKITKTRGHFPTDEAALKLLYLAIRNISAKWCHARTHWTTALTYFAQLFGDRFVPEA